ncbi:UNVERIFIED_CONTAM: hypothetical protein HDU68_005848, partial [Siphonaria sp. JEL0065]
MDRKRRRRAEAGSDQPGADKRTKTDAATKKHAPTQPHDYAYLHVAVTSEGKVRVNLALNQAPLRLAVADALDD